MGSCCSSASSYTCDACALERQPAGVAPSMFAFSPFASPYQLGRPTGDPPPGLTPEQVLAAQREEQARTDRLAREAADRELQTRREAQIGLGVRDAASAGFDAIRREQERARAQAQLDQQLELERIRQAATVERLAAQNQASNLLAQRGISTAAEQIRLLEAQSAARDAQQGWWEARTDWEKAGIVTAALAAVYLVWKSTRKGRR